MMALQKYKKRFSNFMGLSFNCITEDRYIYVKNKNDECFNHIMLIKIRVI